MPCRVRKGETCPAGLGWGKHALGGWLGQVRLGKQQMLPFWLKVVIRQTDIRKNGSRQIDY